MNERGFIYPVTLCLLLLFSTFLSIQFHQYISDKRFLKEIETFERNQFYFLQSIKRIEKNLNEITEETEEIQRFQGKFLYDNGVVTYTIEESGTNFVKVILRVRDESGSEVDGFGYYDKEFKQMVQWEEN